MMPLQGSLSIERMCQWRRSSRRIFALSRSIPSWRIWRVRSPIQAIAVELDGAYGYRLITADSRRGCSSSQAFRSDHAYDNLCRSTADFRVTTDSAHDLEVF